MSDIVANLDSALADYRARNERVDRAIVLFGREWKLVPELTTTTANALASVVRFASESEDVADGGAAFNALMAVSEVLPSVIDQSERAAFLVQWKEAGVPIGALDMIVEAVMKAFTAAPFSQETVPMVSEADTPAHSSASTSSPMLTGLSSSQPLQVEQTLSQGAQTTAPGITDAASSGVAVGG